MYDTLTARSASRMCCLLCGGCTANNNLGTIKDVPLFLQFNPYVHEAYRKPMTHRECITSLCYNHNEGTTSQPPLSTCFSFLLKPAHLSFQHLDPLACSDYPFIADFNGMLVNWGCPASWLLSFFFQPV